MRHFDDEVRSAIVGTEQKASGTGANWFSMKEDNEEFIGSVHTPLTIVDIANIPSTTTSDGTKINAHNVVIFNDGHQLSTRRFFGAKGISWPVGSNSSKAEYVIGALEGGVKLTITPDKVTSRPMKKSNGAFVGPNRTEIPAPADNSIPSNALMAYTLHVKPVVFPELATSED